MPLVAGASLRRFPHLSMRSTSLVSAGHRTSRPATGRTPSARRRASSAARQTRRAQPRQPRPTPPRRAGPGGAAPPPRPPRARGAQLHPPVPRRLLILVIHHHVHPRPLSRRRHSVRDPIHHAVVVIEVQGAAGFQLPRGGLAPALGGGAGDGADVALLGEPAPAAVVAAALLGHDDGSRSRDGGGGHGS
jgi:hypothetical protein